MSTLDERIQQAIEDLHTITETSTRISETMSSPHSTTEDFDRAIQAGIRVLEEMEQKRGGIDL